MWFLEGRINRTTYFAAFAAVVGVIIAVRLFGLRSFPVEFLLVVLCVPRMHDIGWSGRWAILLIAALVIGTIWVGASVSTPEQRIVIAYTTTAMIFALTIWLGCLKGTDEWNQYGNPPPKGLSFGR